MKWRNSIKGSRRHKGHISCAQNLHAEQHYIFTNTPQTSAAQVRNLVGTCRITSTLGVIDLLAVSNLLPNALFDFSISCLYASESPVLEPYISVCVEWV